MKSSDLPVLLASSRTTPSGAERYPLDRIRMQKAVFLLTQRGPESWRSLYAYEPYNWGPYSGQLASDVRALTDAQALTIEPVAGSSYGQYRATAESERASASVWESLPEEHKKFLRDVRRYVTSRSFQSLLREVYAAYPKFAVKSQFSG